jgi:hypothetical protein
VEIFYSLRLRVVHLARESGAFFISSSAGALHRGENGRGRDRGGRGMGVERS